MKSQCFALIARVLGAGATLLLLVVLARLLGVADVGLFSFALTVINMASIVGRFGVDGVALRAAARSSVDGKTTFSIQSIATFGICGLALASVALMLLSDPLTRAGALRGRTDLVNHAALVVVPVGLSIIFGEMLKGANMATFAILCETVFAPLFAGCSLALFPSHRSVSFAIGAYGAGSACAAGIAFMILSRKLEKHRSWRVEWSQLLRQGWPFIGVALLNVAFVWVPTIAISYLSSAQELGRYAMAARFANSVNLLVVAANAVIAGAAAAAASRGNITLIEGRLKRGTCALVVVGGLLSSIIALIIPYLVVYIGKDLGGVSGVTNILLIGQAAYLLGGLAGGVLLVGGEAHSIRNILLLAAGIAAALNVALVPLFGAKGAAVAFAAAAWVVNIMQLAILRRKTGILPIPGRRACREMLGAIAVRALKRG